MFNPWLNISTKGKNMKKALAASLIIICFSTTAEIRSVHCPLGCPSLEIRNSDVVFNHTYALSNNSETKFAIGSLMK
tara:strand:- start:11506 stop:11736 length:231 start_codon:yes stop_codon:yes gene_type:complete